jgi:outer membrane protein assembly factor BamB
MDGKVYCLNATTGALKWAYQTHDRAGTGNGAILASPTVDTGNGKVYIGNESSKLYALDGNTSNANGSLLWSADLPVEGSFWDNRTGLSSVSLGVVSSETRLYIGSDNGHVYCLSTATSPSQRIIWDYAGEDGLGLGCIESSPTVYAGNVYVGTSWYGGKDVVALNASTGNYLWHRELQEEVRATCAAADGHVYIGVDTGHEFYRLDATTGATDPNEYPPNPFHAENNRPDPAGTDNYFVGSAAYTSAGFGLVGNDNFALYTLSSTDNSLIRTRGIGGIVCSSPAISYAAQSNYRWVYFVSRVNGGTLFAYRQILN